MVAKGDRLGHLQVGETGQDGLRILLGHLDQGFLQLVEQHADLVHFVAQPQAHIGGNLVVARASGVQAFAGIADQLGQAGLDVEVHVLQIEFPLKGAGFNLLRDLGHAFFDGGPIGG